jgi:hypothetical protein
MHRNEPSHPRVPGEAAVALLLTEITGTALSRAARRTLTPLLRRHTELRNVSFG